MPQKMTFNSPITEIIQKRYSCRTYLSKPLSDKIRRQLAYLAVTIEGGPFSNRIRFKLAAATEEDSKALRGLGTYGFIKNAAGFIIGTIAEGERNLEDFGYKMEKLILHATDLGLGTCWLGGTFTKSTFAQRILPVKGETIPAVTSVGYIAPKTRYVDIKVREFARANQRRPWERSFFDSDFNIPLQKQDAGGFETPLEMVRLGPSASNRQPWQVIRVKNRYHFYLRRTPGYLQRRYNRLLQIADLQRVDMGIAMCHFELTARERELEGDWEFDKPNLQMPNEDLEYTSSWVI